MNYSAVARASEWPPKAAARSMREVVGLRPTARGTEGPSLESVVRSEAEDRRQGESEAFACNRT